MKDLVYEIMRILNQNMLVLKMMILKLVWNLLDVVSVYCFIIYCTCIGSVLPVLNLGLGFIKVVATRINSVKTLGI